MKKPERFMFDTNMVSFAVRGGNAKLEAHLEKVPAAALCVSTITQGELLYGLELNPGATTLKKLIQDFLQQSEILPWDSAAATHYSVLRAHLKKAGTPLSSLDVMIAAHALAAKAVLVTNDKAFARVPNLQTEDWSV